VKDIVNGLKGGIRAMDGDENGKERRGGGWKVRIDGTENLKSCILFLALLKSPICFSFHNTTQAGKKRNSVR
jgi:hypothetical protein